MLTIYAPSDKPQSKCWEIFNGVQQSWPDTPVKILDNGGDYQREKPEHESMFWGLVNNNSDIIRKIESFGYKYWFTDTPYFGRFDNSNLQPDNHYWRICKNNIHVPYISGLGNTRLKPFNLTVKEQRSQGDHILVCPSSAGIHKFIGHTDWLNETVAKIKKYTDRPIVIRHKPRGRGTSGPSEAKIPLTEQLKNAWCCVTSCSISAVESLCEGVPVICHQRSFAQPICDVNIANIENPKYVEPFDWLNSLSYQQFTPKEFANGTAVSILKELGIL